MIALVGGLLWAPAANAGGRLDTGVFDPLTFLRPDAAEGLKHTRDAGARFARLSVTWRAIAATRPADPANHTDPAYRWDGLDLMVQQTLAAGLTPIFSIEDSPSWAQKSNCGTSCDPSADAFADFGAAAATRYNGCPIVGINECQPAVRYWEAWNEPNIFVHLNPQYRNGKPASPGIYRSLLNKFTPAVKNVNSDNVVIGGTLHPFGRDRKSVAPLRFMRSLLCMSADPKPRPTCSAHAKFDIWGTNPYTQGGPTHKASTVDGVSLGDLPKMRTLLRAAERYHHIDSPAHPVRFWVTEFSWDSRPPDPGGVPASLHARWVSEAMYRAWLSGVSNFIWFLIRDEARSAGQSHRATYGSGLFLRGGSGVGSDSPKPAFRAFRFPFVAYTTRHGLRVWGRTPDSSGGTVRLQRKKDGTWRNLRSAGASSHGVFSKAFRTGVRSGSLRATFNGEVSRGFSLKIPRTPSRVCVFGC